MAVSVNRVILVVNLGTDPEVRNTQSGKKIEIDGVVYEMEPV